MPDTRAVKVKYSGTKPSIGIGAVLVVSVVSSDLDGVRGGMSVHLKAPRGCRAAMYAQGRYEILQHGPLASGIPQVVAHELTCILERLAISSNHMAPGNPGTQCESLAAAIKRAPGGSGGASNLVPDGRLLGLSILHPSSCRG
jgi:hypothetical protein